MALGQPYINANEFGHEIRSQLPLFATKMLVDIAYCLDHLNVYAGDTCIWTFATTPSINSPRSSRFASIQSKTDGARRRAAAAR
jgi:hypothetical protein